MDQIGLDKHNKARRKMKWSWKKHDLDKHGLDKHGMVVACLNYDIQM